MQPFRGRVLVSVNFMVAAIDFFNPDNKVQLRTHLNTSFLLHRAFEHNREYTLPDIEHMPLHMSFGPILG